MEGKGPSTQLVGGRERNLESSDAEREVAARLGSLVDVLLQF